MSFRDRKEAIMNTQRLGNSDLHITPIGFGAWAIGGSGWEFAWGGQDDHDSMAAIHEALDAAVGIAILSLSMGMMNTTLSRVGGEPVSLTFVTGDLNRIGSHLALAVARAPLPDIQGPWDSHLRRAGLLASVWAGFLAGAALSGAATSYFGVQALLPPVLILLALTFSSTEERSGTKSGAPR
jgi:uncharacterized membrane protein YoaK (UPF0700 family)